MRTRHGEDSRIGDRAWLYLRLPDDRSRPLEAKIKPDDISYEEVVGVPTLTWQFPLIENEAELEGHYCVFYVNGVPAGAPTLASDRIRAFPDSSAVRPQPGTTVMIRCYGDLGDEYSDDYRVPGEPPAVPAPGGLALVAPNKVPTGVEWASPATSEYSIRAINSSGRPLSGQVPASSKALTFNETVFAGEFIYLVATDRTNAETRSKEYLKIPQFEVNPPVDEGDVEEVTDSWLRLGAAIQWTGVSKPGETISGDVIEGALMDISMKHTWYAHDAALDVGDDTYRVGIEGHKRGVPFRLVIRSRRGGRLGATRVFIVD